MVSLFGWGSSSSSNSSSQSDEPSLQRQGTSHQTHNGSVSSSSSSPPASLSSESSSTSISTSTSTMSTTISSLATRPQTPSTADNTNLKLFFGGMAFFALSVFVTRRASLRKRLACVPPYYSSSIYHQPNVNGAMEAFEALNLATLNVISFGMMATGGVMYALNINGVEDMRRIMRGTLDDVAAGKTDDELEKDVAEWVSSVLGDRFEKQLEKEKAKKRTAGQSVKDE
ncbi:hypothetical protein N7539_009305 [Penicillium diatomitis]|uniref:Altered inheritance of mitochondria protein 11 n=1 Tax=Penicillium diatomitis TaxID=2819901 RepID=A0A9X0BJX9_9EURO|nr:uncharacterized protein N7539_009305 [Penicillium diatomitis]KAJ5469687.1 hypothetical protein N7539_009305 [Penicillium diatomitis]